MRGKTLIIGLVIFLILFGAGLFYAINFAHYATKEAESYEIAGLEVTNYREINATSSPIKFRACFDLPQGTKLYGNEGEPTPLVAPYWFDCYDAKLLTDDLALHKAQALAYEENNPFGVTSYMAVYPDGHAVAWRQLNACGEAKFSGEDLPPECEKSE